MFYGNPRINNGDGIYNGGGGGGGSFVVDLGGGVSQTLVFPPYLQPVEYIDTSNVTDTQFCMLGAEQIPVVGNASKFFVKFVIKVNKSKITSTAQNCKPYNYTPPFIFSTSNECRANCRISNNNEGIVEINFGNRSSIFYPVDFDKKLTLITNAKQDLFQLMQDDAITNYTDNRSVPGRNFGFAMIFNYQTTSGQNFNGRVYYGYIKHVETNEIYSLIVPARAKDPNDTKPYIVECVGGSVLCNCSESLPGGSGVEFGPDIDLSDEIPNWIT